MLIICSIEIPPPLLPKFPISFSTPPRTHFSFFHIDILSPLSLCVYHICNFQPPSLKNICNNFGQPKLQKRDWTQPPFCNFCMYVMTNPNSFFFKCINSESRVLCFIALFCLKWVDSAPSVLTFTFLWVVKHDRGNTYKRVK